MASLSRSSIRLLRRGARSALSAQQPEVTSHAAMRRLSLSRSTSSQLLPTALSKSSISSSSSPIATAPSPLPPLPLPLLMELLWGLGE